MNVPVTLSMSGQQHEHLQDFLFPADGKEAVAFLLCGRRDGDRRHRLLVQEIYDIPYELCSERTPWLVTWPTDAIENCLERAEKMKLSVVKIHSHPKGFAEFSQTDDQSDYELFPMISGWVEHAIPHASTIMLPSGEIFGRYFVPETKSFKDLACVNVAGDDLMFWYPNTGTASTPDFLASQAQIFDDGTLERLQRVSVGIVGASGTGSPTIEQLVRLGVGEVVIVDDDHVESRNLNRIINTTRKDAEAGRSKVDALRACIERIGIGTNVIVHEENVWDIGVVKSLAQCDIIFGCVDSVDGRYLLNAISSYYTIPYFDMGVRLVADEREGYSGIREVCGSVNYLQPGRSSLVSRGLFTFKEVANASLRRTDPEAFQQQVNDGYIDGVENHRPAVISVNMFASSLAVNEFLARLHPYREEENSYYAAVEFSLASMEMFPEPDDGICNRFSAKVGIGDRVPLLEEAELTERKR